MQNPGSAGKWTARHLDASGAAHGAIHVPPSQSQLSEHPQCKLQLGVGGKGGTLQPAGGEGGTLQPEGRGRGHPAAGRSWGHPAARGEGGTLPGEGRHPAAGAAPGRPAAGEGKGGTLQPGGGLGEHPAAGGSRGGTLQPEGEGGTL